MDKNNNPTPGESQEKGPPPKRAKKSSRHWLDSDSDDDDEVIEAPPDYRVPSTNPQVLAIQRSYQEGRRDLMLRLKRIADKAVIESKIIKVQSELDLNPDQANIPGLRARRNALRAKLKGLAPAPPRFRNVEEFHAICNNYARSHPILGVKAKSVADKGEKADKPLTDAELMPPPAPKMMGFQNSKRMKPKKVVKSKSLHVKSFGFRKRF